MLFLSHRITTNNTNNYEEDYNYSDVGDVCYEYAARTGYRQQEQNELYALRQQVKQQAEEIERLQSIIKAHEIEH